MPLIEQRFKSPGVPGLNQSWLDGRNENQQYSQPWGPDFSIPGLQYNELNYKVSTSKWLNKNKLYFSWCLDSDRQKGNGYFSCILKDSYLSGYNWCVIKPPIKTWTWTGSIAHAGLILGLAYRWQHRAHVDHCHVYDPEWVLYVLDCWSGLTCSSQLCCTDMSSSIYFSSWQARAAVIS